MNYIELIGYAGSALIAISLMMKNIYYLRRINLIGASTFAVYGLLTGTIPVFILNSFISIVDIYYIMETKRKKEYFTSIANRAKKWTITKKVFGFLQK